MNLAIQITRGLSAEVYKYKKTLTFWLLIIAPAFIPAINFLILWRRGGDIIKDGNAWDMLMQLSMGPANFLFPFFIIMIALLVNSLEYNANTWKLIYAQPLSRFSVYFSKVTTFVMMLFITLMLFTTFTILVGISMRFVKPGLGFEVGYDYTLVYSLYLKIFLCTLAMAAIQFWISQRWKNMILSLGVGIAGVISSLIVMQGWKYAKYHPYSYHVLTTQGLSPENNSVWASMEHVYYSLIVAAVFFIGAGIEQTRKRIV